MIRLGQDWIQNVPLMDVHGNNGSIDGDSPAAMRYTESRLEEVVSEAILKGIKKDGVVPMIDNFDDTIKEPVVLPTRIPLAVVNGVTGISAGYSTDILPHNLTEIMKGLIYLYENPDASTDELIQIIPAPDFATGGYITGNKHYRSAFESGYLNTKGIKNRCKFHVDNSDKKIDSIIVTEIPYNVKKTDITKKIEELASLDKKDTNKFVSLLGVADLSSKGEIFIKIDIEKDANVDMVMAYLFKKTDLQVDKNKIHNVLISDKKPKYMGMKEILVEFNKFRTETVIKEINYDKEKLEAMLHLTEGYIKLSDIIEDVVKVIKESTGKDNASKLLVTEFEFSKIQADAIVTMALHRISKTDKAKYVAEKNKYEKGIKAYESILGSKVKLKNYILKQYEEIIEKYGTERKTTIIHEEENWEIKKEDTIVEEEVYVGVSEKGYVKRSSVRSFNTTENPDFIEGDTPVLEVKASNKDVLMVFTSECNYMYLPIHTLEDVRWKSKGIHLGTIITQGLSDGEEVVNAFVINPEKDANKLIFTAKSDGKVKRTTVAEHIVIKKFSSSFPCIKSSAGEKLIQAQLIEEVIEGDTGYIGFKNNLDKTMFFSLNQVLPKGLKADGMRGILMKDGETITDSLFSMNKQDLIDNGYNEKARGGRATK